MMIFRVNVTHTHNVSQHFKKAASKSMYNERLVCSRGVFASDGERHADDDDDDDDAYSCHESSVGYLRGENPHNRLYEKMEE